MKKINSLYIHFPHCLHLCNYCDFFKNISKDLEGDISSFENNVNLSFEKIKKKTIEFNYSLGPLQTLYIGGGTPSLWGMSGAKFLKEFIFKNFNGFEKGYEFTLEVNPKAWSKDTLEKYIAMGVNRFSVGVQSLNANYLKILDRFHSLEDVIELLEFLNEKKVNFSVDLMLGLPMKNTYIRNINEEIDALAKYNPNHFSVYILTIKENYKYFNQMPLEDEIEAEYLSTVEYLSKLGFFQYEVSNFSKPGFESKHNLKYWDSSTVLALGPSATGLFAEHGLRIKWNKDATGYDEESLNISQINLEKVYMLLRTRSGIKKEILKITDDQFNDLKRKWESLDFVNLSESTEKNIKLNAKGYLMLDSLMNDLYSYIE